MGWYSLELQRNDYFSSMAASKAQKEEAARLLALGRSEAETADTVGVSRSSIQGWKRNKSFQQLIEKSKTVAVVVTAENLGTSSRQASQSDNIVIDQLSALKNRERTALENNLKMLSKLREKTLALIESTDIEDLSPRQIPSFVKACGDLEQMAMTLSDRIAGVDSLIDFFDQFEGKRS